MKSNFYFNVENVTGGAFPRRSSSGAVPGFDLAELHEVRFALGAMLVTSQLTTSHDVDGKSALSGSK